MAFALRKKYFSFLSIGKSTLLIMSIYPALDLIQSRALDTLYSNFQSLMRLMQELLIILILIKSRSIIYTYEFQQFLMKLS